MVEHADDGRLLVTASTALLALDATHASGPPARGGAPRAPPDSRSRSAAAPRPLEDAFRCRCLASTPAGPVRPLVLLLAAGPLAAQESADRRAAGAAPRRGGRAGLPARALPRGAGLARLGGAAGRRHRRGPDRRSRRRAPAGADPAGSRLHGAGRGGLRARPAGDSAGVQPLMDRLTGRRRSTGQRRGGDHRAGQDRGRAGRRVLRRDPGRHGSAHCRDRPPLLQQAMLESWRLGPDAPVTALLPFLEDTSFADRWRATYSLGRLKAPPRGIGSVWRCATTNPSCAPSPRGRSPARYARRRVSRPSLVGELLGVPRDDADPAGPDQRRPVARGLSGLGAGEACAAAAGRPVSQRPGEAATTLGALGGAEAAAALARVVAGKGTFAVRRAALRRARPGRYRRLRSRPPETGSEVPIGAFARPRPEGRASRRAGAAAPGSLPTGTAGSWRPDSRPGRRRWRAPTRPCWRPARRLLGHADAGVRSVAGDVVSRAGDPADLTALVAAVPPVGQGLLSGCRPRGPERHRGDPAQRGRGQEPGGRGVSRGRPRARATTSFVAGPRTSGRKPAARWGPAYPIADRAHRAGLSRRGRAVHPGADSIARPQVLIDIEQRGAVEVQLQGPEAPLTVANFVAAGGAPVLRRPPVAPGGAQLRDPGRRPARRRVRRSRRRASGTRSTR